MERVSDIVVEPMRWGGGVVEQCNYVGCPYDDAREVTLNVAVVGERA